MDSWTLLSRFDFFFFLKIALICFQTDSILMGLANFDVWQTLTFKNLSHASNTLHYYYFSLFIINKDLGTDQIGCHDFLATLVEPRGLNSNHFCWISVFIYYMFLVNNMKYSSQYMNGNISTTLVTGTSVYIFWYIIISSFFISICYFIFQESYIFGWK